MSFYIGKRLKQNAKNSNQEQESMPQGTEHELMPTQGTEHESMPMLGTEHDDFGSEELEAMEVGAGVGGVQEPEQEVYCSGVLPIAKSQDEATLDIEIPSTSNAGNYRDDMNDPPFQQEFVFQVPMQSTPTRNDEQDAMPEPADVSEIHSNRDGDWHAYSHEFRRLLLNRKNKLADCTQPRTLSFALKILTEVYKMSVSHAAVEKLFGMLVGSDNVEFKEMKEERKRKKIPVLSYRQLRNVADEYICKPSIFVGYKDLKEDKVDTISCEEFPRKMLSDREKYKVLYDLTSVDVLELCIQHHLSCRDEEQMDNRHIIISVDGVPKDHSSGISLIIVSFRFTNCQKVYFASVYRPYPGYKGKININDLVKKLVTKLEKANFIIDAIVADAPCRCVLREGMGHTGRYACDLCRKKGESFKLPTFNDQGKEVEKHVKIIFPFEDQEEVDWRTDQNWREAALYWRDELNAPNNIRTNSTEDEILAGVRGYSMLLDIPTFGPISSIPIDYMHLICEGVAKRMLVNSFKVKGTLKYGLTGKSDTEELNRRIRLIKFPSEFSHKTDALACDLKAQEYRSFAFYLFFIVAELAPSKAHDSFILLGIICKAVSEPDNFIAFSNGVQLSQVVSLFCSNYLDCYGEANLTYNFHLMSHICKIREKGPLTTYSTFRFEHFYGVFKKNMLSSTMSISKQAMKAQQYQNLLQHQCQISLVLKRKVKSRSDDSLIYTKAGIYKIVNEDPVGVPDAVFAYQLQAKDYSVTIGNVTMLLHEIGIFTGNTKRFVDSDHMVTIPVKDIVGKVIHVEGKLFCVPNEVLRDN